MKIKLNKLEKDFCFKAAFKPIGTTLNRLNKAFSTILVKSCHHYIPIKFN